MKGDHVVASAFMLFSSLSLLSGADRVHRNVSELLDNLLRGYDNSVRPDFGGSPLVVEIDIMVRSMGPISEVDMTYSMDMYFRQTWIDTRLSYSAYTKGTLALSISMLERIWKPDTYFYNGKQSYLHTITTPNKFVRLYQDGRVLYSSRLTVKASCPMNLEDFPMDTQRCPLKLGSFGYTTRDVLYHWKSNASKPVDIAADMKMSQFDLISTPNGNATDSLKSGQYSCLLVDFHLQRHMGNFLIQVYGPCTLLVVLSWVSFWLNREATADRVSLGVTTVLTMTFLGLEARTDLPKVPYPTALDFFVFLSFAFIFATIIQFAVVHYFTKNGSGELYFNDSSSSSSSEDEGETENESRTRNRAPPPLPLPLSSSIVVEGEGEFPRGERISTQMSVIEINPPPLPKLNNGGAPSSGSGGEDSPSAVLKPPQSRYPPPRDPPTASRIQPPSPPAFFLLETLCDGPTPPPQAYQETAAGTRKLDKFARIFFPLSFLCINVFYWYSYLYKATTFP
ncbi:Gamma-aminobutyric acid receptor subunit alpha-6, partial [Orchesella cincta]